MASTDQPLDNKFKAPPNSSLVAWVVARWPDVLVVAKAARGKAKDRGWAKVWASVALAAAWVRGWAKVADKA